MFGATLALKGALEEVSEAGRYAGLHCESGCMICEETARQVFELWLRTSSVAQLADHTPRIP